MGTNEKQKVGALLFTQARDGRESTLELDVIGPTMPSSSGTTTPASAVAGSGAGSATPCLLVFICCYILGRHLLTTTMTPANLALSPTTSKLPRFLQSPAARDRSKSLSVDRRHPLRLRLRHTLPMRRAWARTRARAEELLVASPPEYDGFAPSSYTHNGAGSARPIPRTRSERHFSASTPPPSSSSSSNGHPHNNPHASNELTLARTPSRLGARDGALAPRLSGCFAHLAGSTNELSIAATISGAVSGASHTAAALSPRPRRARLDTLPPPTTPTCHHASSTTKSGTKSSGGAKTSLLDKAVRYLLDGDASPHRSTEEIWLMGYERARACGRRRSEGVGASSASRPLRIHPPLPLLPILPPTPTPPRPRCRTRTTPVPQ
ncbi:hypothetical protein C8R45DRAFT_1213199 [Mycena sanguinolenta]|nr:hypothetical protein C8R45DRAFT_1213199 [Mycena sanguinolenta]